MIVLDSAALVDAVVGGQHGAWALDQITEQHVIAPAHQLAEVLSAVARLVRAEAVTLEDAKIALESAASLDQELIVSSIAHLEAALAMQERVRVGDGLYIALAAEYRCPLVTTDRRLAKAGANIEVRSPM